MTQDPIWSPMTASDSAKYVASVHICAEVTPQGTPANLTREFRSGQKVYLVCAVKA